MGPLLTANRANVVLANRVDWPCQPAGWQGQCGVFSHPILSVCMNYANPIIEVHKAQQSYLSRAALVIIIYDSVY